MKTMAIQGCFSMITFCYVMASATTIAAKDVSTLHFTSIDLGKYNVHVFPSDDCSKQFSTYGTKSLDGNESIYWGDTKTALVSIGSSLFINDRHYLIPGNSKLVWILDSEVFVPGKGTVSEAPVPADIARQIKEESEDSFAQFHGIVFGVKKYFILSSAEQGTDDNFCASLGPFVFLVKNGRLVFRGKDYGAVKKGDEVVLDETRRLTIQKATVKGLLNPR